MPATSFSRFFAALLFLFQNPILEAVEPGDSLRQVMEEKGRPQSMNLEDGETTLRFADGMIVLLREGKVVGVFENGTEPPPKPPRPPRPPTIRLVPQNGELPPAAYAPCEREAEAAGITCDQESKARNDPRSEWKEEHKLEHIGYASLVGLVSLVLLAPLLFRNREELSRAIEDEMVEDTNRGWIGGWDNGGGDWNFVYGELNKPTLRPFKFFLWAGISFGLGYGTFFLLQNFTLARAVIG